MELADRCYESVSFGNIGDGKSEYGLCHRAGDCCGPTYAVEKGQTRCLFGNADRKLSIEEIRQRDERESEKYDSMQESFERARKIVASWPKWKREIRL